jgi:molybdenum cofactor cytidylyltransferase
MKVILLAAGFSSRMGELKQVMDFAGKPMVCQVAESLLAAGLELVVVIGYQSERVKEALHSLPCEYIINEHPEDGMFSSVKLGCLTIEPGSPCLITTCDCPGILPITIRSIKNTLEREQTQAVIPTFHGKKGHPVGLPAFLVERIQTLPPATPGLHSLWRHTPEIVFYLEVNDPAVLRDLDKPEDIKKEVS